MKRTSLPLRYAPAFGSSLEDETDASLEVAGTEVGCRHGVLNPGMSWTWGTSSTLDCANDPLGLERAL
jgi:hypothetical protein